MTPPAVIEDGSVALPETPGLGIELVESECEAHPYVPVDLSLFSDSPDENIMKRGE